MTIYDAAMLYKKNSIPLMIIARLDAPVEMEFYRRGGILHTFIRNILSEI